MADDQLPVVAQANEDETQSPFERIRHTDEGGDYWLARELAPLLEYSAWQDFDTAAQRAMADCAKSGRSVDEHFEVIREIPNNSEAPRGRPLKIIDSPAMPAASSR
ncbi:MAG TPA: hypothetical protein VMV29_20730 [Ktedonobacterales bacterium]|nr:hypothetical protein [Ktedonobacterales bacterium]